MAHSHDFRNSFTLLIILTTRLVMINFTAIPETYITTNLKQYEIIEEIYLKVLFLSKEDPICLLPKVKKIELCEKIFRQMNLKNLPIYVNKLAFFVNTPTCVKKFLGFRKKLFFVEELVKQEMYPCYGRHYSVHTDYRTDDFYNTFYISSGLEENSIFVYIHHYDNVDYEDFFIHSYHTNVKLSELSNKLIHVKEIAKEFDYNKAIVSTRNQQLIEYIYDREKDESIIDEKVCYAEIVEKASLCKFIFDRLMYKKLFWTSLNNVAYHIFNPICRKQKLELRLSGKFIWQSMFPCFSRTRLSLGNTFRHANFRRIYLSEGPRKNSISVYFRAFNAKSEKFYLFEILENIDIKKDIERIKLTEEIASSESLETWKYVKKISLLMTIQDNLFKQKLNMIMDNFITMHGFKNFATFHNQMLNILMDNNKGFLVDSIRRKNYWVDDKELFDEIDNIGKEISNIQLGGKNSIPKDFKLKDIINHFLDEKTKKLFNLND